MNYTQSKGNVVELQCISKCIELGYECSIPYGNGAKYDFIVDVNGQFLRVQCKSCFRPINKATGEEDDAIQINTVSQTTNTQKTIRHCYSKEQIDYFATYYNNQVYFIPVEQCSRSKTLRFSPPKNGNKNYNKAEDYEIEKFLSPSVRIVNEKQSVKEQQEERRVKIQQTILTCRECGSPITRNSESGLCSICYCKTTRKADRPPREELKKMIREESFIQIGKNFNVTDNAIRKWCDAYNLPRTKKEIKKYPDEDWEKI